MPTEDFLWRFDPDEEFDVAVLIPGVTSDGALQFGNELEDTTPDSPSGGDGEEVFDDVEAGNGGRGKVEYPSRMVGQSCRYVTVFLSSLSRFGQDAYRLVRVG